MDDLIGEFITETMDSLSLLDSELINLEKNPNDTEILGNIFRLVHTIKGTCGFLGLPRLESVAHAGENVLGKFRDGEIIVDQSGVSVVLESLDCVRDVVDYLSEHGEEPEGDDTDLINRLNAFADGNGGVAEAEPEVVEEVSVSAVSSDSGMVSSTTQEELDALERAFQDADVLVDMGDSVIAGDEKSQEMTAEAEVESVPVATEKPKPKPPAPKPSVKQEAVKKGLETTKDSGASSAPMTNQTIRVSLGLLEHLMSSVGELVLTRNQLAQLARNLDGDTLKVPLQRLNHITSELQEGVMKTRMQPIGNAWSKFPRLIRDLSLELNKKIELTMEGEETELDRQLLEMIKDPLTHMVRNSCDHGLEDIEGRAEAGKSEVGSVKLSAYHEGGHIIIEIADDGRGVNIERVTEKIIESGLASEEEIALMTEHQIAQFIFRAGFSTAEAVTSVSGRGVGMDVVRTNIESIGGTVELKSETGKGSVFHIKIPLTLAIVSVLVVDVAGQNFGIPQINVVELVRAGGSMAQQIEMINGSPVLRLREQLLPLISLDRVLEFDSQTDEMDMPENSYIVVCRIGAMDFGMIVDAVFDTEEIVVKPVSAKLSNLQVYSGNTVLGDGSVIMILDPNGVARAASGELIVKATDEDECPQALANANKVNFLLFTSGTEVPKAVPLELVSRLEELDATTIEYSEARPVVQYRGGLMRLYTIDDEQVVPKDGMCEVIVFTYDGMTTGLVVDAIIDIVAAVPEVQMSSSNELYMGSIVMSDHATDVIDVGQFLTQFNNSGIELGDGVIADGKSLLFVEDSMFFRNLTVPFLASLGYDVVATEDAAAALEVLASKKIDVIVTDIEMPKMTGFEFAQEVSSHEPWADIPIIAFTSTMDSAFDEKLASSTIRQGVLKTERDKLVIAIAEQLSLTEAV